MRSTRLVVAFVALVALPARADTPARWWSFVPPAGWVDTTADHADQLATLRERFTAVGTVEAFQVHASADGTVQVLIYETRIPGAHDSVRKGLTSFESGARDGIKRSATEVRYVQREEGNVLVVDQVVTSPDGQQVIVRRVEGADRGRAYASLVVTCAGDEATCAGLLLGVRFDQAALLPLDTMLPGRNRGHDESVSTDSASYRLGRLVGLVGSLIVLVWLLVRSRRAKRGGA